MRLIRYMLFRGIAATLCLVAAGCPWTVKPAASFTFSPESGNPPLDVQFTDTSTPGSCAITSWLWDFGDDAHTTSPDQNASFTYAAAGTYTVSLTVTTSAGTDTATATISVTTGGEGEGEGEVMSCPGGSLFGQLPTGPDGFWFVTWNDEGVFNAMYDNFSGVDEPIGGIQWWGLNGVTEGGACERDPDNYVVTFYEAGEQPGDAVAEYAVTPLREDTGLTYNGRPLYRYSAVFETPCSLSAGWVSVLGVGEADCWALWVSSHAGDDSSLAEDRVAEAFFPVGHDLGLCLTRVEPKASGE